LAKFSFKDFDTTHLVLPDNEMIMLPSFCRVSGRRLLILFILSLQAGGKKDKKKKQEAKSGGDGHPLEVRRASTIERVVVVVWFWHYPIVANCR
jgi:hypothetical protein